MLRLSRMAVVLPLVAAAGCSTRPTHSTTPVVLPDITGNWAIQSVGPPPPGASTLSFVGALKSSESQVTGTLRLAAAGPGPCNAITQPITQAIGVSGSLDGQGNLTLTSAPFAGSSVLTVQLSLNSTTNGYFGGTMAVAGGTCALPATASEGAEYLPLTGSFTGPVSPDPLPAPGPAVLNPALAITQATTPNPDGQFAVSGAFQFTSAACTVTLPVSGTISGSGYTLVSSPAPPAAAGNVTLSGSDNFASTQLLAIDISFAAGPCANGPASQYSGYLLKQ